jgi:hypothetical protein
MKLSEANARLLTAIRAAVNDSEFTAGELLHRCAGLAAKENAELVVAIGRKNAKRLGHWLAKLRGVRLGALMLESDYSTHRRRWVYVVTERSNEPPPSVPKLGPWGAALAGDPGLKVLPEDVDKVMASGGYATTRYNAALAAAEHRKEREERDDQRAEDRVTARAAVDELHSAEAFERNAQAARDADATKLFTRQFQSTEDRLPIIALIDQPEKGVEARLHGEKHGAILILLRGPWAQRKARFEQLTALWRRKGWCSEHERPFDGMTPELLHGKEIPPGASQEPEHYGTAVGHERLAVRLLLQGIGSNELSLEEAAMRERRFIGWASGLGGGMHRGPGLHSDPLGAIHLKKFDPLQRPDEPERSC